MLLERMRAISPVWRQALARLGAAWLVLILAFRGEWLTMVDQWFNSSTYGHVAVVPVILGWLVWVRAPQLARLEPACWWPGLGLVGLGVGLWAMGAFMGVGLAAQAGAVLALAGSVPLLLGVRVAAGLAFPLGYMAFLVPVGDELIPALQTLTAKMTIALLHLTGVPARMDGVILYTPIGWFKVAEACSGMKFLTAMIAFGVLASNVCFVGWRRRAVFLAVCAVSPVLANGVRAWGTVYVAQSKGIPWANSFDHVVYGWFFFALVISLIIAGSWRWFNRPAGDPMINAEAIAASPRLARWSRWSMAPLAALGLVAAGVGLPVAWVSAANDLHVPLRERLVLPPVAGWHLDPQAPRPAWRPRGAGARMRVLASLTNDRGERVEVFLALFDGQGPDRKPGAWGEGAVPPNSVWAWRSAGPVVGGYPTERLFNNRAGGRLAQTLYRLNGITTASRGAMALAGARDRAVLRARPTAMLILSAADRNGVAGEAALADFRAAMGPVDGWIDAATSGVTKD